MPPPLRNREDVDREREALEDLVRSEGFRIFEQHVMNEWTGAGYFARMGVALTKGDPLAPKVVHETSLELQRLFQRVRQRVIELKGQPV